jgi:predicted RND superfamily exporter protein
VPSRKQAELAFEAWGRFVLRFRWLTLGLALLVALTLGSQLPQLTVDNSDEALLQAEDPDLQLYHEFGKQFGRDDLVLVALRPPEVFELGFLEKLRAFHEDLEQEVPYLDEVRSLLNARSTYASGDRLIVEDLLEDWPETPEDLAQLKRRALSNPLYLNTLISEDAHLTTVSIVLQRFPAQVGVSEALAGFEDIEPGGEEAPPLDEATAAGVQAVREVIARHASAELPMYLTGPPVFEEQLNANTERDIVAVPIHPVPALVGHVAADRRGAGVGRLDARPDGAFRHASLGDHRDPALLPVGGRGV